MFAKTTLMTMALLCFFQSFGQLKITQTQFNGETYNVYPVRLPFLNDEDEGGYGDYIEDVSYGYSFEGTSRYISIYWNSYPDFKNGHWKSETKEFFLPYNPFQLKDGKYLAYYKKRALKWDQDGFPVYEHADTVMVAVTFELVNNKKHGKVVWYDYGKERHILQECAYSEGEKSGKWTIYRENEQLSYTYLKGALNGEWLHTKKDRLYEKKTYVLGSINGDAVRYRNDKPKQIREQAIWNMGSLLERKEFDKKGKMEYWYNRNFGDGKYGKRYEDGKLTEERYIRDTSGLSRTVTFFENGNVKEDYTDYRSYAVRGFDKEGFERPYWYKFFDFTDDIVSPYNCVRYKQFYENGRIRLEYDLRVDTLTTPLITYRSDGTKESQFELERNPQSGYLKHITDFTTTDLVYRKRLLRRSSELLEEFYDAQGNLIRFDYAPEYLTAKFPDSTGFVVSEKGSNYYGRTYVAYNLLHTSEETYAYHYKGKDLTRIETRNFLDDGMPMAEVQYIIPDKKGDFEARFTHQVYTPKFPAKEDPLRYEILLYYGRVELPRKGLRLTPDSLQYQIYYHGKPFSGDVYVEEKNEQYSKKTRKGWYKVKAKAEKKHRHGPKDTVLYVDEYWTSNGSTRKKLFVYNGRTSVATTYYKWGSGSSVSYKNGKKDGEINEGYCDFSTHYKNGRIHGIERLNSTETEYFNGRLHGERIEFGYYSPETSYDGQIDYRAHFHLDTLHGWYISYVRPMEPSQQVYFKKGLPHGKYWRGNVTAPTSAQVTLNEGYLVDTAYYYFNEGTIKAKVSHRLEDQEFFYPYYKAQLDGQKEAKEKLEASGNYTSRELYLLLKPYKFTGIDILSEDKMIDFEANRTGHYQYFYKNGIMASTGEVRSGYKVGTWKYWDLSGGLYKKVEHDSDWFVNPITKDSIFYYGKVKMWYPNGKELLTGLILSKMERFKCDQEMKVDFENLYYLSFYDKDGNQSLTQAGGKVHEYHNNSERRLEGEMKDGKRFGVWKFYDPNGRLEETGKYVDGLKEGLWIAGDLEAVPYYEDLCISGEVDAYKFPDIKSTGFVTQPIVIKEMRYNSGSLKESDSIKLLPLY
ncbi:MAG: hypothetical protein JJ975_13435 [Bacteroidia bacterium]|nr:hypothetical protein [Bacteroidia bacterium]